ncbi:DUF1778 domain-containing protein [Nocardioides sp.]|jgi:uncharacterized protein (DUF1778 family)|uniref:type II toxin-antitoxin system TacA family antitoxin n=1 Tax=Nocardioides sp. TaxID=35761 RepID=UPI002F3ED6AE
MDEQQTKSERMNIRVSADALSTIREAAALQGQDMTSFVMGAAMERARAVLAEDQLLRLSPQAVTQLERALDREPAAIPQLAALFKKYGTDRQEKGTDSREHVTA